MKTVLVLGAGRCAPVLVSYLLEHAQQLGWQVVVGDLSIKAATDVIRGHTHGRAVVFDVHDAEAYGRIQSSDVVISLLPPHLHIAVAQHCLQAKRHLITASYQSNEMKALDREARKNNLLFLNECGLDPGLDHMSAMRIIDGIKKDGGRISSFESFAGGLIAHDTDPFNPWRYKFTWNSMNVVTAGQKAARYKLDGQTKYIPYQQLFKRIIPVSVDGYGQYEGYMNRDSLQYVDAYGLQEVLTMVRGTLRNSGFCSAWNILVQLGCCDNSYDMERVDELTHKQFLGSFLPTTSHHSVEVELARYFHLDEESPELIRLRWSGFFSDEPVGLDRGTPAQILEHILNKKWKLADVDRDMIVMWHRFRYRKDDVIREAQSSLVEEGANGRNTAMAKTVGLPLAIVAKLLLTDQLSERGVMIPVTPAFYNPVLDELARHGIVFNERETTAS